MPSSDLKSANLNLWKEVVDSTTSTFFSVMMDVLHVLILVRMLTQENVGVFFFSYAFVYLFIQVTRGYGKAIRKKASEYNTGRSKFLWAGIFVTIPTLIGIFIVFWSFQPIVNEYSSLYISNSIIISIFSATIGYGTLELGRYYLAGCNKPGFAEKVRAFPCKISMILITIGVLTFYPTVETALLTVAIVYGLTGIYLLWVSPHSFMYPTKDTIIDILHFSKWSLPTSLLNDFYHRWDTILLGFMVGSISLSYYESSVRIGFLSAVISVGLAKSANVKLSGLHTTGKNVLPVSKQLIIVSTFLVIPFLLITLFNGEYILNVLYGEDYTNAKWYLVGITVAQLFQCYRIQFETIFNSVNQPRQTTKTSLVSVIVNVITAPPLVLKFGGLGVIYSTLIAEIVRLVLYEYQIKILFGNVIAPRGVFTQFGIFTLLLIIIGTISTVINLSSLSFLIVSSIISICGFYSLQYTVSPETKQIVKEYRKGG